MFKALYEEVVSYMDGYFTQQKPLNIEKLDEYIESFLQLAQENNYELKDLIPLIDIEYTEATHSVNVSLYATLLGVKEGYIHEQLMEVALAGLLLDIGKTKLPSEIREKNSFFSSEEFEVMKEHPIYSEQLAKELGVCNQSILHAIKYHHENYDGTGYPSHLHGKAIPNMAQILGICDAFDALTTERSYRDKYSSFNALLLINSEMRKHYRPELIKSFITLLR